MKIRDRYFRWITDAIVLPPPIDIDSPQALSFDPSNLQSQINTLNNTTGTLTTQASASNLDDLTYKFRLLLITLVNQNVELPDDLMEDMNYIL
jgi:hypothetical protein